MCSATSDSWDLVDCSPASSSIQWNFPGKSTRVSWHNLLQGIFLTQESNPHLLHWQVNSLPLSNVGSELSLLYGHQRTFYMKEHLASVESQSWKWWAHFHGWSMCAELVKLCLCYRAEAFLKWQKHLLFMAHCSMFDTWIPLCEDGKNLPTINPAKFWAENIISDLFVTSGTNFMVIKSQTIYWILNIYF